jgi:hypothetical protein
MHWKPEKPLILNTHDLDNNTQYASADREQTFGEEKIENIPPKQTSKLRSKILELLVKK